MKDTAGLLVTYTARDGRIQKAAMRYSEQFPEIEDSGKALIRLLNDDFTEKLQNGRVMKVVKRRDLLTTVGFCD